MKVEEQLKRDETPTKEFLKDLPVSDEHAIRTSGGGDDNDDSPTEEVNFSFGRVRVAYQQKP